MTGDFESAQRFILNNIPDIAWLKDIHSRYVAVNDAFGRFCGRPPEEVVGLTDESLWPRELASKYRSDDQEVIRTGRRLTFEETIQDRSGNILWIETIKTPFKNSQGTIVGSVGIARDISDRKKAEAELKRATQEFQIIFDAIPATIWFKDMENRFVRVNKATTEMMKCRPEDLEGKSAFDVFPRAEAEKYFRDDLEVIRSGKAKLGIVEEAHTTEGNVRIVRTDKIPYINENGKVSGLIAIAVDITEREDLLLREKRATEEAIRANRAKDLFLAMLSHELRTPLTTIKSWAELLKMTANDASKVEKGISMIERAANTQARLIDDLLDLSRIISGKFEVKPADLVLSEPMCLALESVRSAAAEKGIQIQTDFQVPLGQAFGDATRLQQIFYNLLANAIKFTPPQGRVIARIQKRGNRFEIEIEDTGPGIDPEFFPYLFDPFSQADISSTRKHGGLGLGLSISRNLAEAHGGSIRAENIPSPGKGAKFTVTLPDANSSPLRKRMKSEETLKTKTPFAENWRQEYSRLLNGIRVLIVDDEETACEAFRETLVAFGLEVRTATSAAEAFHSLSEFEADVLISDIAMPGEDGYSLIRRIRALSTPKADIPAIAITAYAASEDVTKALRAGFQMHLAKPVNTPAMLEAIAGLTCSQQLRMRTTSRSPRTA